MSRFRRLSHSIWHCQYHIVWVLKYRYRILVGAVREAAEGAIQAICGYAGCAVVELNVQRDHVSSCGDDSPKLSISELLIRPLEDWTNVRNVLHRRVIAAITGS